MSMDLTKLTVSDRLVAGSGIALFIFSFLPWYGKGSYTESGWSYFFWGIIPTLIAIVLVALVAIRVFAPQVKLPELPYGLVFLGGAGLAALLVILKLLIGAKYSILGIGGVTLDRKFGLILSVLAALGLVGGGFLKFQGEERPNGSGSGGNTPPTPF